MPCSASTSATVWAPVCTGVAAAPASDSDDGAQRVGGDGEAVQRDLPGPIGGQRERRRILAELDAGPVRRCRPSSRSSRCWPLMVRVSRRPRSRAICEPSEICVSAAGASTSCSPACRPAEDSAPVHRPGQGGDLALLAVDGDGHVLGHRGGGAAADARAGRWWRPRRPARPCGAGRAADAGGDGAVPTAVRDLGAVAIGRRSVCDVLLIDVSSAVCRR